MLVGAGSAGCVLAHRLTEDPATSVLLLEAGGNDETVPEIHDPIKALELAHTAVDWAYATEEEPHLNNRKIDWPRGKVLGAPVPSTICCMFVGIAMTLIIGKRWETQAGATPFDRIS
jgi:choline dehydrogenase